MPHTNRKKKTSTSEASSSKSKAQIKPKLQNFEDEDGWTHVSRGKKWVRPVYTIPNIDKWREDNHANMQVSELFAENERHRRNWENSDACRDLKTQLLELKGRDDIVLSPITNIVCLGLGSPSSVHMDSRQNSNTQLAALDTIKEILEIQSVPSIAQDPIFHEIDKELLRSKGYEVVEDPAAFSRVDTGSLVYMIGAEHFIFGMVWEYAKPAMMICQDLSDPHGTEVAHIQDGKPIPEAEQVQKRIPLVDEEEDDEVRRYATDCEIIPVSKFKSTFHGAIIHWHKVANPEKS